MSVDDPNSWSERYRAHNIPWDLGRAHPELVARLERDPSLGLETIGDVYVPGCGLGHDAASLGAAGWRVTASDFATAVASTVEQLIGPDGQFLLGDSLKKAAPCDLWFDHTFFCAIPLDRRPEYGTVAAQSVRPGGRLISVVFPVDRPEAEGGPPFGMSTSGLGEALGSGFRLIADEPAIQPPNRRWKHRWAVWERT